MIFLALLASDYFYLFGLLLVNIFFLFCFAFVSERKGTDLKSEVVRLSITPQPSQCMDVPANHINIWWWDMRLYCWNLSIIVLSLPLPVCLLGFLSLFSSLSCPKLLTLLLSPPLPFLFHNPPRALKLVTSHPLPSLSFPTIPTYSAPQNIENARVLAFLFKNITFQHKHQKI